MKQNRMRKYAKLREDFAKNLLYLTDVSYYFFKVNFSRSKIKFLPIKNQILSSDIFVNSPNDMISLELSHTEFKNLIE